MLAMSIQHKENSINRELTNAFQSISLGSKVPVSQQNDSNNKKVIRNNKDKSKDNKPKLLYQKQNLYFIKNKNGKQHQYNKSLSNQIKIENSYRNINDLAYQDSIVPKCDSHPFQFSLDQTDMDICRNTANQMNEIRHSIIIDMELASHLNLLAFSSEQILFNQQRNAFMFYEQMKQIEITNWLNTKSDEERKLYLERTQQI